jgi:predicted MFS family arabinose efflux permease
MRAALGTRGAPWLLGAGLVSLTGDWVLRIGLAFWVYARTHSTLASAFTLLASFLPQILVGSLAGVFVDRWSPKRTMIVSNLLLGAGLLPLLLPGSTGKMWVVYVVLAWEGVVQQFFLPSEQKAVPLLVETDHLLRVNALASQNRDLSRLAGSAIGGTVVATLGLHGVVLLDVASFVIAAAMIVRVRPGEEARASAATDTRPLRGRLRTLRDDWSEGVRVSASQRALRTLLIFVAITSVGEGTMGTLFAPFVRAELHGSGADFGLINSLQAVGGIAGALLVTTLGNRMNPAAVLGRAAVAFGLLDLAMFLYPLIAPVVWPAAMLMVVVGFPGALILASSLTLLQSCSSDEHRGRVFGALGAVEGIAVVLGTIAAGVLAQQVGIVPVLVAQGAGYVVAGTLVSTTFTARREPIRAGAANPAWLP